MSFLGGINFSFGVRYHIQVEVYGKFNGLSACILKYDLGATAETGVNVDASAAVRLLVL